MWDGEKYILLSARNKRVIRLSKELLVLPSTKARLEDIGFFKNPEQRKNNVARLGLILTTACNLKCKYCYVINDYSPHFMEAEYAIRILKEYSKKNYDELHLSFFGGEPTLNPGALKTSIEYVENHWDKYIFHITTNGTAETSLYDYLISKDFYFTLSMDGTPKINSVQRPYSKKSNGNYLENILGHFVRNDVLFQIRVTVTSLNLGHFPEFIKYCADYGVKYIHFEVVSTNSTNSHLLPSKTDYINVLMKAIEVASKNDIFLINSAYMNLLTPCDHFCRSVAGEKILYTPDKYISLCYKIQSHKTKYTDFIIGKYSSVKDSFEIDRERISKMKNLSVYSYSECKDCFAKSICAGGCPERNITSTGSLGKIDKWICSIKKMLIHDAIIKIYNHSKAGKESAILGNNYYEFKIHEKSRGGENERKERVIC